MKVRQDLIEDELLHLLENQMRERGFILTKVSGERAGSYGAFVRATNSYDQKIAPVLAHHRNVDYVRLDFGLRIRIFRILEVMRKYWTCVPDPNMRNSDTTAACLMTNLRARGERYDWRFRTPHDVGLHVADIMERLDCLAIPFLEKYSSEEVVECEIEHTLYDLRARYPLPRTGDSCEILLVMYLLRGETEKFRRMVPVMRKIIELDNYGYYLPTFDAIVAAMSADYKLSLT